MESYGTIERQMRLLGFLGGARRALRCPHRFRVARRSRPACRSRSRAAAPAKPRRASRAAAGILQRRRTRSSISTRTASARTSTFEALRDCPRTRCATRGTSLLRSTTNRSSTASATSPRRSAARSSTSSTRRTIPCCASGTASATSSTSTRRSATPALKIRASIMDRSQNVTRHQLQGRRLVARRLSFGRPGVVVHAAGTGDADARQFVTLEKNAATLTAVFRASGGTTTTAPRARKATVRTRTSSRKRR